MRKLDSGPEALDVDERLPLLVDRLRETPGLVALLLYGSYGTDRQTPLSDVDLAVIFHEGKYPEPEERLRMTGLVVEVLETQDVSLTFLERAPLPFQHEVLRTGRTLLVRDDVAFADFRERVIHRYCDFAIDYRAMLEDYDEGLRKAYGSG